MQLHRTKTRSVAWYWCFTLSADREKALEKYIKRFGKEPEEMFEEKGLLWLGPVSTEDYPVTQRKIKK